jgi:hypothetical protein
VKGVSLLSLPPTRFCRHQNSFESNFAISKLALHADGEFFRISPSTDNTERKKVVCRSEVTTETEIRFRLRLFPHPSPARDSFAESVLFSDLDIEQHHGGDAGRFSLELSARQFV